MFLTYQKYLLSIETRDSEDPNLDFDFDSDDWDQYFDIETEMIINYKNKYIILKPCIQFRQLPINKFFRKKNQKQKIDILESIKEDPEIFEDIETGKIETNKTNANIYLHLINLQNIIVTLVFYISHVALVIFLVRVY